MKHQKNKDDKSAQKVENNILRIYQCVRIYVLSRDEPFYLNKVRLSNL